MYLRKFLRLALILLTASEVVSIRVSVRADQPGETNQRGEGRPIPTIKEIRRFTGHQGQVVAVAYSPDGKTVASAGNATIRLWEADTAKELRRFGDHRSLLSTLVFSPDGKTLASASLDETILLWDVGTGHKRGQLAGKGMQVRSLVFSPDGKYLAATMDGGIRLWKLVTGKEVYHFHKANYLVHTVIFSSDNKTMIGGGSSLEDEGEALPLDKEGRDQCRNQKPSPPSAILAWRLTTGTPLPRACARLCAGTNSAIAFSPNGRKMALAGYQLPGSGGFGGLMGGLGGIGGIAGIGGVGGLAGVGGIAGMGGQAMPLVPEPSTVHLGLWEMASGQERNRFQMAPEGIATLAFSPDGQILASVSEDGSSLLVWDVDSGKTLCRFAGCRNGVYSVAFSPHGKHLAGVGADGIARIWKVPQLKKKAVIKLLPEQMGRLWQELAVGDAGQAFRAMTMLGRAPEQSARLLHQRLRTVPQIDARLIPRLISDLDNERYAVRKRASQALERIKDIAEPFLRKALQKAASLETRIRVERLLAKVKAGFLAKEDLRIMRALEVLEHLGSPEAKQALEALAKQKQRTWWTEEAKTILQRVR